MNINQMEYAIALAEYKKHSEVSKHLYVAQSSISKQICLLEEEFGIRLFERLKSGTELTPEGKIIVEAFKSSRASIQEAVERAKYMRDCGGTLKIGVSDSFESCPALVRAMEALRQKYTPEQLTGKLAKLAGLRQTDAPVTAIELAADFSWDKVPRADIPIPPDF